MSRVSQKILIVLFLGFICLPLPASLFQTLSPPADTKNLREVLPPDIKTTPVTEFVGLFKYFFEKNFFLKQDLVNLNAQIRTSLFPERQTERVLKGDNGYYFLNGSEITDYIQRRKPFDDLLLNSWADYLTKIDKALSEQNINFYVAIAPNKHEVYFNSLPSWLQIKSARNIPRNLDLETRLNPVLRNPIIDMSKAVTDKAATTTDPLFFYTDTHWNEYGAAVGSAQIIAQLAPDNKTALQYEIVEGFHNYGGDLARLIGLKSKLTERYISINLDTPATCIDEHGQAIGRNELDVILPRSVDCTTRISGKKLLVFTDSFGMSIIPSLSAAFPESRFIFGSYSVDFTKIEEYQPDIVLYLMVARKLQTIEPSELLQNTFSQ